MSHDQKGASDWMQKDPVAEQLVCECSGVLKGVACKTNY